MHPAEQINKYVLQRGARIYHAHIIIHRRVIKVFHDTHAQFQKEQMVVWEKACQDTLPHHTHLQSDMAGTLNGWYYDSWGMCRFYNVTLRKRNALPITDTELRLMAAAAIMGLSSSPNTG